MLFKKRFIKAILSGAKTQTRRCGKMKYRVGSIQPCKTSWFGKPFGYIRILDRYDEVLGDISSKDLVCEGFEDKEDFRMLWNKMYGMWNPGKVVTVYVFRVASEGERNVV